MECAAVIHTQLSSVPAAAPYWSQRAAYRSSQGASAQLCNAEARRAMIEQAAYFLAKHRGFTPGHELEDWLAAEREVDTALAIGLPL